MLKIVAALVLLRPDAVFPELQPNSLVWMLTAGGEETPKWSPKPMPGGLFRPKRRALATKTELESTQQLD